MLLVPFAVRLEVLEDKLRLDFPFGSLYLLSITNEDLLDWVLSNVFFTGKLCMTERAFCRRWSIIINEISYQPIIEIDCIRIISVNHYHKYLQITIIDASGDNWWLIYPSFALG